MRNKTVRYSTNIRLTGSHFLAGTRQAFTPGGHRTGAPGTRFFPSKDGLGRGKYKTYHLVDKKVRVYIAPPVDVIRDSKVRYYESISSRCQTLTHNE